MKSLARHPKQAEILVYSKDYCPYCDAAKNLLTQKGVAFELIDVTTDQPRYDEMLKRSAPLRTVPQIFIDGKGIGGFDDMRALDLQGALEKLLFPKGR